MDATRALDDVAASIEDAEAHGEMSAMLDVLRQGLGRLGLREALTYPLIFDRVSGDYTVEGMQGLPGVRLEAGHAEQLRTLVDELKRHCGTYAAAMDLTVFGSSSLVPFMGRDEAGSERLNVRAADARGINVADGLAALLSDARLPCGVVVRRCVASEFGSIKRPEFADGQRVQWQLHELVGRTVFIRPTGDPKCNETTVVWPREGEAEVRP